MTKQLIYGILTALITALTFTACSSDDESATVNTPSDGKAHVTLRIGVDSGSSVTRAWTDPNAKTDRTEMMYSWYVVLTNASNEVVFFGKNESVDDDFAEIDIVNEDMEMEPGTYYAYNFANISEDALPACITNISDGDVIDPDDMAAAVYAVSGNGFIPSETNGIPMSNKQTLTIAEGDTEKDLIVVRMLAKMELHLYNDAGSNITVTKVNISDITKNATDNSNHDNLKLLPDYGTPLDYPDDMEDHHQDIRPNVSSNAVTEDYTYTLSSPLTVGTDKAYDESDKSHYENLMFYINESPQLAEGKEFYLTLEVQIGTATKEFRYALISDNLNHEWNYIARNDYRVIPIIIDDYKLELIPYDFPPIGVYPCSVREIESELYEMTFHDYGHFHLVPKVTKGSGTGAVTVPFGSADGEGRYWTLKDGNTDDEKWTASFKTAAIKGGAWVMSGNPNLNTDPNVLTDDYFYRNEAGAVDGDEAGGVPVWYANTSSPQWDPAGGTNYTPFIFGYIGNPPADWWAMPVTSRGNRQVYHEFRVKLFVGNTYRRDLLYRYYMTLDAEQMLGVRSMGRNHIMRYSYDE